jgi:hypothetical protein
MIGCRALNDGRFECGYAVCVVPLSFVLCTFYGQSQSMNCTMHELYYVEVNTIVEVNFADILERGGHVSTLKLSIRGPRPL